MSYKVINNTLNSEYGVDTISGFFHFRKIKFWEIGIFKQDEQKTINEKEIFKNINNQIVESSVGSISIDKLLGEVPKKLSAIVVDIKEKAKIFKNKKITTEDKIKEIIQIEKIVINQKEPEKDEYKKIVYSFFNANSKSNVFYDQLNALYTYVNKESIDWYDLWCVARSINKIFSLYFQSLFDEIPKILTDLKINSAEWYIKKLQSNKKLEIYEMFKFINRTYETWHKEIISSISIQENKEKFNILKSFLESEAKSEKFKNSYFYIWMLEHLKSLRDFHAHEDEGNIEKLSKSLQPNKIKEKLYNKFLGNLLEDGNGFLQNIINKQLDVWEILQDSE